jgi:hypothetical protein
MAQVVERLSKHETLNSNPSITKKNKLRYLRAIEHKRDILVFAFLLKISKRKKIWL